MTSLISDENFARHLQMLASDIDARLMTRQIAVMVLGEGLHGLHEVGVLGLNPVPFFQLDELGSFPTR